MNLERKTYRKVKKNGKIIKYTYDKSMFHVWLNNAMIKELHEHCLKIHMKPTMLVSKLVEDYFKEFKKEK